MNNQNDFNNLSKITIIGSGYIGLVVGACLSELGNNVICADIDANKIDNLKNGILPIYEPKLEELIHKNFINGKIQFTTNISASIQSSNIIFIAVNTPTGKDERADISAIKEVANMIALNLNNEKIICLKSTVPVGTHKIVEKIIKEKSQSYNFEVVSTPEFLREGSAINDFLNPDRIIIGTKSEKAYNTLKSIYSSTNCDINNIIWTDNLAAETIKYVSNSFLALKISFINEIANFCDAIGVDVQSVAHGVGLDKRIGNQFFKPGPGFGGSCFPKDVLALLKMTEDFGIELKSVKATLEINQNQKKIVIQKLKNLLINKQSLFGKTIAVLGLAFKANTDDIRKSPAIEIINNLLIEGAIIKAYDPKAMENMKSELPDIIYCENSYQAVENADAILVLTEWQEFTKLDFDKIGKLLKQRIILDTRNILNIDELKKLNFIIDTIGRSCLSNQNLNFIAEKCDFKSL